MFWQEPTVLVSLDLQYQDGLGLAGVWSLCELLHGVLLSKAMFFSICQMELCISHSGLLLVQGVPFLLHSVMTGDMVAQVQINTVSASLGSTRL